MIAFAALRISGDRLVPDDITKIVHIQPTQAYAKSEHYSTGPRSPNLVGRTGIWYFSTDGVVAGHDLVKHLDYIVRLLEADPGTTVVRPRLQQLTRSLGLQVTVSCFWHGPENARRPSIPRSVSEFLKSVPAHIVRDFDDEPRHGRRAA